MALSSYSTCHQKPNPSREVVSFQGDFSGDCTEFCALILFKFLSCFLQLSKLMLYYENEHFSLVRHFSDDGYFTTMSSKKKKI